MVARYGILDVLISRRLFGNWLTILMLAKTALKSVVLIHIYQNKYLCQNPCSWTAPWDDTS